MKKSNAYAKKREQKMIEKSQGSDSEGPPYAKPKRGRPPGAKNKPKMDD